MTRAHTSTIHRVSKSSRCGFRAFTLIELLVVIAIVALLIAILLPSLSAARSLSRRTACQTNLRQLAITWQSYFDDYDGKFLKGLNQNVNYGGRQGLGEIAFGSDPNNPIRKPLNPYLQLEEITTVGADVFECPSDDGSTLAQPSHFLHYGTSYPMNIFVVGPNQVSINPFDPCGQTLFAANQRLQMNQGVSSGLGDTSRLILMGDWGWSNWLRPFDTIAINWHDRTCASNLAFFDGHVEIQTLRKGLYTTEEYVWLPFDDLARDCVSCQVVQDCP